MRQKIRQCERIFAEYNLSPCFRLTEATFPQNLGTVLTELGYKKSTPTSVQTRQLADFDTTFDPRLEIRSRLTCDWLEDAIRLNKTNPRFRPVIRDMLECVQLPTCFMMLRQDDQVVATGLGVCDDEYVGLFQVVIDEPYRRQGLGTTVVLGLLDWGKSNGATMAHLQVVPENTPAMKMYQKMDFNEVYQYWYWEKN